MMAEIMSPEEKLSTILNGFFLNEPLFFNVYCTHRLEANPELLTMFRSGNGIIQYSPKLMEKYSVKTVEKYLKIELYRILLKHPYQRMPENPRLAALTKASDVVINEIDPSFRKMIASRYDYKLIDGNCFEEYYRWFSNYCRTNTSIMNSGKKTEEEDMQSQEAAFQQAGLWHESEEILKAVNYEISKAAKSGRWGSIPESAVEEILATMEVKIDCRKILSGFHRAILSDSRRLTRMRPNRRYEENMGSLRDRQVKLLVAIDDSGSISKMDLEGFLSIINRIFKAGVKSIHVITFDEKLQDELELKKAEKKYVVNGRGGTDFNVPLKYLKAHPEYSGMIVFTDGYAEYPETRTAAPVLWMYTSRASYENSKESYGKVKGSRAGWIPRA